MAEVSGSRLVSTEEGLTTSVRIRSTENSSFLHTRHGATNEMQIGAADSAGGQTHNGVEIVFYRRLLDVVESNVPNSMVNDGFHSYSPEKSFWGFVVLPGFGPCQHYREARLCLATLAACFLSAVRVDFGK